MRISRLICRSSTACGLVVYGFRTFKPHGRAVLGAEITRLVQSHLKPKLIFSRALDVLVREKLDGGISALAAAPSSRPEGRSRRDTTRAALNRN